MFSSGHLAAGRMMMMIQNIFNVHSVYFRKLNQNNCIATKYNIKLKFVSNTLPGKMGMDIIIIIIKLLYTSTFTKKKEERITNR